jgi:radical SAM family RiPP maturation amino acid epimerase
MSSLAPELVRPGAAATYDCKPDWRATEAELEALFATFPGTFESLIDPCVPVDPEYASELAHLKRFIERWRGDRAFREALSLSPQRTALEFGLRTNPEVIRYFWDADRRRELNSGNGTAVLPLLVQRHKLFIREKLLHREKLRVVECAPSDRRHRLWRERQMARVLGHLGPKSHDAIIHAPVAIELSDGCSVGCWFCGVSAKKKQGDFLYTPENSALWRDVLAVLRQTLGPSARTGFLYWASEPLDNPDYEKFALDFARVCGRFPQTTTAIAHRDIERTRALLKLSTANGCTINRFSVLGLAQFNRLMEAFTPEELLHCEIISQNQEANHIQSNAGRARGNRRLRERAAAAGAGDEDDTWSGVPGTIACVSGFLINMVRRTVRLITPCPSDDRWPDGYWILNEGRFETAVDLESLLERMMESSMKTGVAPEDSIRFRRDLHYEATERGFLLRSFGIISRCVHDAPEIATFLRGLGERIVHGDSTAQTIADELGPQRTFAQLGQLFAEGYLDEEPVTSPH